MIDVILKEDVPKLGSLGEVVKVKAGFARNYLLPQKLAVLATPAHLAEIEAERRRRERAAAQRRQEALTLAERLKKMSCTIRVNVGEHEKLFGVVTAHEIAETLAQEGMAIERHMIHLEEPIKALGVYAVPIKLHPEVTASVKVWVVRA